MAWTSPRTWTTSEVLTAALLNTHVRDNESYLYDNRAPAGAIIMWHGTIANIPTGWLICDGNNGTPNLLAKFVKGVATAATNPGTTGGATTHTHASHSLPSQADGGTGVFGNNSGSLGHDSVSNEPPYYAVAYLMKT